MPELIAAAKHAFAEMLALVRHLADLVMGLVRRHPPARRPLGAIDINIARRVKEYFGSDYTAAATINQVERILTDRVQSFFGREPELADLDDFLTTHDRGVLLLTADGGMGKTALLANWGGYRAAAGSRVVWHMFSTTHPRTIETDDALRSLALQLAAWRGDPRSSLPANEAGLEDYCVAALMEEAPRHSPLIVILDGLDEATAAVSPIVPGSLGKHVYVIASIRTVEGARTPDRMVPWLAFEEEARFPVISMTLRPLTLAGVLTWLSSVDSIGSSDRQQIATAILRTTEGVPLFMRYVVDDVSRRYAAGDAIREILANLRDLPHPFERYAERELIALDRDMSANEAQQSDLIKRTFALLAVAKAPMTISEIAAVLNGTVDIARLGSRVRRWFAVRPGVSEDTITFVHPRLAEVFSRALDQSETLRPHIVHTKQRLATWCLDWRKAYSTYSLQFCILHISEAFGAARALAELRQGDLLIERARAKDPTTTISASWRDFYHLAIQSPAPDIEAAKAWLYTWSFLEPRLIEIANGPDAGKLDQILVQTLRDIPGVVGRDAASFTIARGAWRLASGHRQPPVLLRVLKGHESIIRGAIELADGRLLSWSGDGTVRMWSREGQHVRTLRAHRNTVYDVVTMPDGRFLSYGYDNRIRLWSADGEDLRTLEGCRSNILAVVALKEGRIVAICDLSFVFWTNDGQFIVEKRTFERDVFGAMASPDGGFITWTRLGQIIRWSKEGEHKHQVNNKLSVNHGVDQLTDGRIVSWGADKTVSIWSSEGQLVRQMSYDEPLLDVCVLPDERVAACSSDGQLVIWASDGTLTFKTSAHQSEAIGLLSLQDGRVLSWGSDNVARVWSNSTFPDRVIEGHYGRLYGVLPLSDGRILTWNDDHVLRMWSSEAETAQSLERHASDINDVSILADGTILSWSKDSTLRLWSREGRLERVFAGHTGEVYGARVLRDGRLLSWSRDGTIRIWLLTSEEPLAILSGHQGAVWGVLELRDGSLLSWSEDGVLRLWGSSGETRCLMIGHEGGVFAATEMNDGRILSWSADSNLRLWASNGDAIAALEGHESSVWGALEMGDGRILSWSADGTLRTWAADGKALGIWDGHRGLVYGAEKLSDGTYLSCSQDNTVRRWSATGEQLQVLQGHGDAIFGVEAMEDGGLISWGADRTLRVWSADGLPLRMLPHNGEVLGTVFGGDQSIISCGKDSTLRVWSADGRQVSMWFWPYSSLNHVYRLPDGDRLLLVAANDLLTIEPTGSLSPQSEEVIDVFVSYAHADSDAANHMVEALRAAGYVVWYDRELLGGERFRDVIDAKIDTAKVVVVLWSQASARSDYVIHEANRALKHDKLLPLLLPDLRFSGIPAPFASVLNVIPAGDMNATIRAVQHLASVKHKPSVDG